MQGVEDVVELTNLGLKNYVKESRESWLTATRSVDVDLTEPMQKTAISWEEKVLHCTFMQQTNEVGNHGRWKWM